VPVSYPCDFRVLSRALSLFPPSLTISLPRSLSHTLSFLHNFSFCPSFLRSLARCLSISPIPPPLSCPSALSVYCLLSLYRLHCPLSRFLARLCLSHSCSLLVYRSFSCSCCLSFSLSGAASRRQATAKGSGSDFPYDGHEQRRIFVSRGARGEKNVHIFPNTCFLLSCECLCACTHL